MWLWAASVCCCQKLSGINTMLQVALEPINYCQSRHWCSMTMSSVGRPEQQLPLTGRLPLALLSLLVNSASLIPSNLSKCCKCSFNTYQIKCMIFSYWLLCSMLLLGVASLLFLKRFVKYYMWSSLDIWKLWYSNHWGLAAQVFTAVHMKLTCK